jgi:hypothetical protein
VFRQPEEIAIESRSGLRRTAKRMTVQSGREEKVAKAPTIRSIAQQTRCSQALWVGVRM